MVATGQVTVDIKAPPPTRYTATVTLTPTAAGAAKACTLTVNVLGKGTVTSTPAGIQCVGASKLSVPTTCTYDFPVGTPVVLATTADPKSYGTSYSGLCTGTSGCNFTFSGPGTVTAGIAARVCSSGNWCWHNPLPQGNTLRAVWGAASNDVWAAGDAGTLLHFDGANWSAPTPIGAATNQDVVFVLRKTDLQLWESAVETASFDATYADQNSILYRVLGFAAFIPHRHQASVQVIGGTGLVAPTFA